MSEIARLKISRGIAATAGRWELYEVPEVDGKTVYACTARLQPREMTLPPLAKEKIDPRPGDGDRAAGGALTTGGALAAYGSRRLPLGGALPAPSRHALWASKHGLTSH